MSDSGEGRLEPDWSDDEQEISLDDLAYLRQVERRSYLMKRSGRNPAVWNKRYCVLSDKLWIINVRGVKPRAIRIDLTEPVNVYQVADSGGEYASTSSSSKNLSSKKRGEKTEKLYEFALDNGLAPEPYHFRAASTKELTAWQDDLQQRAKRSADDSVMQMAELIMSEETRMRSQRLKKSLESLLHSKVGENVLDQLQSQTHNQNQEAIRDSCNTKALAAAAAAAVVSVQTQGGGPVARPAGEFVVYNGASLPSDMERLEALNRNSSTSSSRNEEGASLARGSGNGSKGQQHRLFRRRSGSTSTTTSNTSNGDSSSNNTNNKNNNQRGEKERSGAVTHGSTTSSAKGVKAAINAGLLVAAASTDRQQQQQPGRGSSISARPSSTSQSRELMCKYYQETGIDSSGDSTDEDGDNEEGEGGAAGGGARRGTPYLQVANLEVRRGLSLGHRLTRHHHHTTINTVTRGNRTTISSAGGGNGDVGYSAWNLHSALALVHAIYRFKELLRRDRSTPRYGCPERDQWALAAGIFVEYLSLHVSAAVPSADGESGGGGGLMKATDACFGLSDGCVSELYDAITANIEWCYREDSPRNRASSSGGSVNKREEAPPSGGQDNSGSSSGSSSSFWGSVFGAPTTSAGADSASITASSLLPAADAEKAERRERDASARAAAASEARAKFYVPFPSDTVTASSSGSSSGSPVDPASVWGALMARPHIDANLRTHMVACRLLLHSDGGDSSNGVVVAPPASLYDRVEAELEAVLGAGTNKHNSI